MPPASRIAAKKNKLFVEGHGFLKGQAATVLKKLYKQGCNMIDATNFNNFGLNTH